MFFNILIMSTYREIVYMCLDELKMISDDSYFTEDHIIFLADKYRAFLLKKNYTDIKKTIPDTNYQTLCLSLEKVKSIADDECSTTYLRSVEEIPELLPVGTPRVTTLDFFSPEITYVSWERLKYVGHNSFLRNIMYCSIGPDNKVYFRSQNPQMNYLEKVKYSGIFENSAEAAKLECDNQGDTGAQCDVLYAEFPLEEALIPLVIELIVKELTGAAYKPEDKENNASDDLSGLAVKN